MNIPWVRLMFKEDLLEGKNIIITGGGTGLGKSMALRFGELGAGIAILGRRMEPLEETVELLSSKGVNAMFSACDVRRPEMIKNAFDSFIDHFGIVHALVNNAAGNFISQTERLSVNAVDAVLNIVLHGTFYCTLDLGKRWIAAGQKGTVLNITTTYAWTGSGFVVPSAAAKAGVLALTRSLAVEWGKYGIRHVAIAPGPFETEGAWKRLAPTRKIEKMMTSSVPLGRGGRHDELANLSSYLLSDYAEFINGEVVTIDGGEWLNGAGQFNKLNSLSENDWEEIRAKRPKKQASTHRMHQG